MSRFLPRLTALLVLLAIVVIPGHAQTPSALHVAYRMFTLPNGLTVILHQDRSVPIVTEHILYRVGSANERPGRTGFAHLFEHLMFEGSKHVKEGEFDRLLEAVGGSNNGSTGNDDTTYYIDVPKNALDLALYLESDRMGYLLDAMTPDVVNGQREVVKNERRQSYDNRPYGIAEIEIDKLLYPPNHPYSWPTIGYMEDLDAATYQDVVDFFKKYYVPNNASLVVAGDIDLDATQKLVEKWFGEIPAGTPVPKPVVDPPQLPGLKQKTIMDRVQLPRLYLTWLSPKRFGPDDAAMDVASTLLAGGKTSRLYKRLVYDTQMAQDVSAYQDGMALTGSFQIIVTARPGKNLADIQKVIDDEVGRLRGVPPSAEEMQRAVNDIEASFYRAMERVGSYRGKAAQMNSYVAVTGDPDYFGKDLARYMALKPGDVQAAVARWLVPDRRVELTVQPEAGQ